MLILIKEILNRFDLLRRRLQWLPALLARIAVGYVFAESGFGKLQNLPKIVDYFRALKIPYAEIQAPFVSGCELLFGALLLLGLFTRASTIPLITIMIVAIATAKAPELHGISDLFGLSEFLYILLLIYLLFEGAGSFSLERLLAHRSGRRF